jgi:hypothetical protein
MKVGASTLFDPCKALHFQICSMLLDTHTTLSFIPVLLFPLTIICTGGFMKDWGLIWGSVISFNIYMFLIGICGASMICAFAYRYAAVTSNDDWFYKKKTWVVMGLFHMLLSSPSILTHLMAYWMVETEELMMEYIESVS